MNAHEQHALVCYAHTRMHTGQAKLLEGCQNWRRAHKPRRRNRVRRASWHSMQVSAPQTLLVHGRGHARPTAT